jgi:type III restriction enzyme
MLAFNPTGSTKSVNFNTSRETLWQTNSERCHVNYVVYDSGWEAEFCRVAESHPIVKAYVKNHGLKFRVPYRYGSEVRTYIPDFIVVLGEDDPLHLVVEIKGYRREDAKEKKLTMETLWVPGVNNLGSHGRWAFAEFGEVYQIESNFQVKVEQLFNQMIDAAIPQLVS